MGNTIEIRQKTFFKKNFDLQGFIAKEKLFYGTYNAYYVLRENQISEDSTIVFERDEIGRGIEIRIVNKNVLLSLLLPATENDIRLYYRLATEIADEFHLTSIYRNGEKINISEIDRFIKMDKEESIKELDEIEKKIYLTGKDDITFYCALHPIIFGEKEIDEVNGSLKEFAKILHNLQNQRLYYAVPAIYQKRTGELIVAFHLDEGITTVLPERPVIYGPNKIELTDWYVFFAGGNTLRLETFLTHTPSKEYYDSKHYKICLDEEEIASLVEKYSVIVGEDTSVKGYYFGVVIDSSDFYKNESLVDSLATVSHIAFFLKYAHMHHLLKEKFYEAIPDFREQILSYDQIRKFVKINRYIAGEIHIGFFNEEGRKFVNKYYALNGKGYLEDLKEYGKSRGYEHFTSIPFNEEYEKEMSEILDEKYNMLKEKE